MAIARRFRFAPTPSRELHVGSALAALVGWGLARAARGAFILRIEDIDRVRAKAEHEATLLVDLRWLGLDWDEGPDIGGARGPYRQSERLDRYDALLLDLEQRGLAYRCSCSRADVRAHQSAPHLGLHGEPAEQPYPGTCRGLRRADLPPDRGGLRLDVERLGEGAVIEWHDALMGPMREDLRTTCGDFLLGRPGHPTYQLAVVADDAAMGITDVVRGRDLLASTARQIALHRALDSAPPRYAHHPLIVDPQGRKLSKRDEAPSLAALRLAGHSPEPLIAALGRAIGLLPRDCLRADAQAFGAALADAQARESGLAAKLHDGPWHGVPA